MFTLPKLLLAYLSCRRNKRKTCNALEFEIDYEAGLLKLLAQILKHSYLPAGSICFVVTYPKLREIFAADFKDRILHHLLVAELEPYYESQFVYGSFACRSTKGTLKAAFYTKRLMLKATHNIRRAAYYGQFDIKSFFTRIDKDILAGLLCKAIRTKLPKKKVADLLWLTNVIIRNDPTIGFSLKGNPQLLKLIPAHKSLFRAPKTKGLPIGNLTSQFFANVYLNELDQYCKRVLKIKNYVRYVDDIVVIGNDPAQIKLWHKQIDAFLCQRLKLKLHPDKNKFGSVYAGIDFLGYVIKPAYNLVRKRVVSNLKSKLYIYNHGFLPLSNNQAQLLLPLTKPPAFAEIQKMLAIVNSYYGHLRHAKTYKLRKNIYENHFGSLKQYLIPVENYTYFTLAQQDNIWDK